MPHPSLHPVLATEHPGVQYRCPRGSCTRCGGTGISRRPCVFDQVGCTCAPWRRSEPALLDLIEVVAQGAATWLAQHDASSWGTCYQDHKPFALEWRDQDRRGDGGGCDLAPNMPMEVAELVGLLDPSTVLRLVELARQGLHDVTQR